jgi:hypothetical protein
MYMLVIDRAHRHVSLAWCAALIPRDAAYKLSARTAAGADRWLESERCNHGSSTLRRHALPIASAACRHLLQARTLHMQQQAAPAFGRSPQWTSLWTSRHRAVLHLQVLFPASITPQVSQHITPFLWVLCPAARVWNDTAECLGAAKAAGFQVQVARRPLGLGPQLCVRVCGTQAVWMTSTVPCWCRAHPQVVTTHLNANAVPVGHGRNRPNRPDSAASRHLA